MTAAGRNEKCVAVSLWLVLYSRSGIRRRVFHPLCHIWSIYLKALSLSYEVLIIPSIMAKIPPKEGSQVYFLLSIAFSHFNEKARWAFAYYGVPYAHHLLLPWLHILTTKPIVEQRVCNRESRDTRSSPFSTPCLAIYNASSTNLQESVHDSHDILVYLSEKFSSPEHVNLYTSCGPEKEEEIYTLEKRYDQGLGVAVRDIFYLDILVVNKWRAMLPFALVGFKNRVGILQSLIWFLLSPLLGRMITGVLDIKPERYQNAMETCREEFNHASKCKACLVRLLILNIR
jgi:glutathione S-transferase